MVMVDHGLFKGVVFTPFHKTIDSEGVANIFFSEVFSRYRLYNKIISDCRPQFTSRFQLELGKLLRYKNSLSPHSILRVMERLNGLTKNSKSTFTSSAPTTRLVGLLCFPLLNLFLIHNITPHVEHLLFIL